MTRELEELRDSIVALINEHREHRDFDTLLSSLISDINDLSTTRNDIRPIIARMFARLNTDENGKPREHPYSTRRFMPAYQIFGPIGMALADFASLISIMRRQVFVYTADGVNLDTLGRDFDFPRHEASPAIRRGHTWDQFGNLADFPIGSTFATRDTGDPIIFEIHQTEKGNVLYRHVPDPNVPFTNGNIGNTYYGDLSPASPINGLGRAAITDSDGAYRPGQNRETDEQYRRRFLQFLRRKAFGGNIAQYQQETQKIDGVGNLMIFPCWRNAWTVRLSIVDTQNTPVSDIFQEYVNNLIDPIVRGGTGYGFAPVGHRVHVTTPKYLDVDIIMPVVPALGATIGQIQPVAEEIIKAYLTEMVQAVFDVWERTHFSNTGITISPVSLHETISVLNDYMVLNEGVFIGDVTAAYNNMMTLLAWFPAEHVKQAHRFEVLLQPQIMGTRLLVHELVSAIDFENITINGGAYLRGFPVESTEEAQFLPRLNSLQIVEV